MSILPLLYFSTLYLIIFTIISYVVFVNKYFISNISNYEIINEEFENDKVWVIILKFSTLTT